MVISPFVSARWRRAGAWTVAAVVVLRLIVASGTSTHVILVLLGGATVGTAVLLAFGRPTTQPRLGSIIAALRASGIPVAEMHPASVDARGSVPYFATLEDGAGVLRRCWARTRGPPTCSSASTGRSTSQRGRRAAVLLARRNVEHEALVALQARDVGVRTPACGASLRSGAICCSATT